MLRKSSNYTEKGDLLREQIINYKKKLEHKEFLIDKVTMDEIILDKEFADSLALNINTNAKKAFIDEIIMKDAMDKSKKITIKVVVILCICILLGILLMKVTQVLGKDGIIILYILLVIIIACVADITMMLSTSKKQKF